MNYNDEKKLREWGNKHHTALCERLRLLERVMSAAPMTEKAHAASLEIIKISEYLDILEGKDLEAIKKLYINDHGELEKLEHPPEASPDIYIPGPGGTATFDDVSVNKTAWLWHPYIPRGKITILSADPGVGKTYFSLYITAAISDGRPFWGTDTPRTPQRVFYQTAEDGYSDTIKPRLVPMQPNFSNILFIKEDELPLSLTDERIEGNLKCYRPALMIFDPLQAYLGADVDMHRANEVRPIMSRIGHLAERYDCAMLFIAHNNKMGKQSALHRMLGTIDIPAVARSMLVMANNPDIPGQKLVCHEKSSLAAHGESIAFRIAPDKGGLLFEGFSELKADDVLNRHAETRYKPSVEKNDAKEKLLDLMLEDGAASIEDIQAMRKECGMSERTLYRARDDLQIQSAKVGFRNKRTWWLLPEVDAEEFKERMAKAELRRESGGKENTTIFDDDI